MPTPPPPLFCADVKAIAHELVIRTHLFGVYVVLQDENAQETRLECFSLRCQLLQNENIVNTPHQKFF